MKTRHTHFDRLSFYEFEGGISRLNLFFAQEITLSSCVLPNIKIQHRRQQKDAFWEIFPTEISFLSLF